MKRSSPRSRARAVERLADASKVQMPRARHLLDRLSDTSIPHTYVCRVLVSLVEHVVIFVYLNRNRACCRFAIIGMKDTLFRGSRSPISGVGGTPWFSRKSGVNSVKP